MEKYPYMFGFCLWHAIMANFNHWKYSTLISMALLFTIMQWKQHACKVGHVWGKCFNKQFCYKNSSAWNSEDLCTAVLFYWQINGQVMSWQEKQDKHGEFCRTPVYWGEPWSSVFIISLTERWMSSQSLYSLSCWLFCQPWCYGYLWVVFMVSLHYDFIWDHACGAILKVKPQGCFAQSREKKGYQKKFPVLNVWLMSKTNVRRCL